MKKSILLLFIVLLSISCKQTQKVDLIVTNAQTYTVNSNFDVIESFAIKDGKFVAVGSTEEITNNYTSTQIVDAKNAPIYPGFIDAHCHFYGLGLQQQKVNLVGTQSYEEVLHRLVEEMISPDAFEQCTIISGYIAGKLQM